MSVWREGSSARENEPDATPEEVSDDPEDGLVEDGRVEAAVLPLDLVLHEVVEQLLRGPALAVHRVQDALVDSLQD